MERNSGNVTIRIVDKLDKIKVEIEMMDPLYLMR